MLALGALLAIGAAAPSAPARVDVRQLNESEEQYMALSAAPESLRAGVGIYQFGSKGFRLTRASSNGFNCLVEREESHGLSPLCFDPEGSRTTLHTVMRRGELIQLRKSWPQIGAIIAKDYRTGRLHAPRHAGVAYMLSEHFSKVRPDGRTICIFPTPPTR
jgi:hypothetical protein